MAHGMPWTMALVRGTRAHHLVGRVWSDQVADLRPVAWTASPGSPNSHTSRRAE